MGDAAKWETWPTACPNQLGDGAASVTSGQLSGPAHITTYGYDGFDRLVSTSYADGTSLLLTLDNAGRPT